MGLGLSRCRVVRSGGDPACIVDSRLARFLKYFFTFGCSPPLSPTALLARSRGLSCTAVPPPPPPPPLSQASPHLPVRDISNRFGPDPDPAPPSQWQCQQRRAEIGVARGLLLVRAVRYDCAVACVLCGVRCAVCCVMCAVCGVLCDVRRVPCAV